MDKIEGTLIELTAVLHQGIQRFHNCKVPVIIAVNGMVARGAGLVWRCLGILFLHQGHRNLRWPIQTRAYLLMAVRHIISRDWLGSGELKN